MAVVPPPGGQPQGPPVTYLPMSYRTIFFTVVGLTVLSLAASVYLVSRPAGDQAESLKGVIENCNTTWKMGFGAIIGLLAGKLSS